MTTKKHCVGCGKKLHTTAKHCPGCGYTFKHASSKGLAILGLLVNVFFWPGLGTIIGGDIGTGIAQMILTVIGLPLSFILIGIPILIGAWIWALISSINQLSKSE